MKKSGNIEQLIEAGRADLKVADHGGALQHFLDALALDKDNPEIHYFLGITYARLKRYDAAIDYLKKVINSELAYIHKVQTEMILGYIYTLLEDYESALPLFRDIVKSGIESAPAYAAIGYILDRLGKFKEAVLNLYRAIEIDPTNANAHNSLGYIFAESNLNLDEALKECKKAVSLDRQNPAYLDSLGWVHYKLGEISQARSYLKKALKYAPDNREIRHHLEVVLKKSGR